MKDIGKQNKIRKIVTLTDAGITYSIASKHSGNSCILLGSPPETDFLLAQIEHIIQFVSNNILNTMVAI